jgi:hypothetical protein
MNATIREAASRNQYTPSTRKADDKPSVAHLLPGGPGRAPQMHSVELAPGRATVLNVLGEHQGEDDGQNG